MRMKVQWIMAGVLFVGTSVLTAQEYKVGPGDILNVRVMDQAGLSGPVKVSPDGAISVPLIGSMPVKDMTLPDIESMVGKKFESGYLKYPVVTVTLEESHSRRFFIYGEVKTPGEYPITRENMTVLQAISQAGGLTKGGSESKIRLLRPKQDKSSYDIIKINLKPILSDGVGDEILQPDDVIMVREGWF